MLFNTLAASPAAFERQAKMEPGIPALCLTSESDSVIKAAGVRAFAKLLKDTQPGRPDIPVTVLRGQHVMQVHVEPDKYEAAVADLAVRAGLPERAK